MADDAPTPAVPTPAAPTEDAAPPSVAVMADPHFDPYVTWSARAEWAEWAGLR